MSSSRDGFSPPSDDFRERSLAKHRKSKPRSVQVTFACALWPTMAFVSAKLNAGAFNGAISTAGAQLRAFTLELPVGQLDAIGVRVSNEPRD